jgi:predicted dehydrogenase
MGAGASQGIFGERFLDPEIEAIEGVRPHVTLYDPNPDVVIKDHLPNLNRAIETGQAQLTHAMPEDHFDVAVIATASENHAEATEMVLSSHGDTPPLFVLEKPLAATWQDWRRLYEVAPILQPRSVTNEPYFYSEGIRALQYDAGIEKRGHNNQITEIRTWASKRHPLERQPVRPHGELGPFGVELPHLLGGASLLADELLGSQPDSIVSNTYYADIDDMPNNDATYLCFNSEGKDVHISQGLGAFAMDGYGHMTRMDAPPVTKRVSLRFENDHYLELDLSTAFPPAHSPDHGYSTLWHFLPDGTLFEEMSIPDDPRRTLARHILRSVQYNTSPMLPNVTMSDSLERSRILLQLREDTEIWRGRILEN